MIEAHKVSLWLNTVRHLHPAQVSHRVRLRAQQKLVALLPISSAPCLRRAVGPAYGWPSDFVPLDLRVAEGKPSPELNSKGVFEFLNHRREDCLDDWRQPKASLLWRYHLHYFEWLWPFVNHEDREWAAASFETLWRSWNDAIAFGRGTPWAPYVASLRTWVLCGAFSVLASGRELETDLKHSIAEHAGFVRAHVEFDVGGNHLVKNLKALVGAGCWLRDEALLSFAVDQIKSEIPTQVLDDGGHYERSPSYHCQVLGDLIDIHDLLAATGGPVPAELHDAVIRMREWLGKILLPDGDVPVFNDSIRLGRRYVAALNPVPSSESDRLTVLPASGYIAAGDQEKLRIVVDAGIPCPPELPAHAHSDCLSFELAVGGRRIIVNSGISTYEAGPRRDYERSTRAHNTIEIDLQDQTETWGQFRAARRAGVLLERTRQTGSGIEIIASHDGYVRLSGGPIHRRRWLIRPDEVRITDDILGQGKHAVAAWLHFAEGVVRRAGAGGIVLDDDLEIVVDGAGVSCELVEPGTTPEGWVAPGFGRAIPSAAFVLRTEGPLPLRLTTRIKTRKGMPTTKS